MYLCDNCDKDFDSLQDLITHEKGCGKKEVPIISHTLLSNNGLSLHMFIDYSQVVCLEAGVTPQEAFLASNFKLCSRGGNPPSARFHLALSQAENLISTHFSLRKLKEGQRPKASSYDKFMDIELSSPLGRFDELLYTIVNNKCL